MIGNVGGTSCFPHYMNLASIRCTIRDSFLVFVPILGFVIGLRLILSVIFINFDDTILDEALLKTHALFFDVFIGLQAVHDHVVGKVGMCITDKHFKDMSLRDGAGNGCGERFPLL